jgi:hypothetical protein
MAIEGTLEPLLDELEAIAEPSQYTTAAVAEVQNVYKATTSARTAPDGTPWKETKDGQKPLKNAFAAIDVRQAGPSTVIVELKGHHVFPHYGAKGHPVREIINKEVDEKLGNAIRRGVAKPFKERK